jgi:hypothetical protein
MELAGTNGFTQTTEKTPFEKQRDVLIGQITQVRDLETALTRRAWSK